MSSYRKITRSRGRSSWKGRRKGTVSCSNCGANSQEKIWKPSSDNSVVCQACFARKRSATPASMSDAEAPPMKVEKTSPNSSDGRSGSVSSCEASRRPSARQASLRHQALTGAYQNGGLPGRVGLWKTRNTGRRTQLFKNPNRPPGKAPTRRATVHVSDSVWEAGIKFEVGDIVSMEDEEDGNVYYAQIRGLLTNEYAERFATVTWLLPTIYSPTDGTFDPDTFVYGPNEERLYPMSCISFHAHPTTPNLKWRWNAKEEAQMTSLRNFQVNSTVRSVPLE